ncbi:metabolite traffic protein EboE [Stieleria marina]|uniref:Xylose isomerase-like TIM barrel n=1 Tax=Stieleria marina TaxID=1930275 RepID=A0A517NTX9_9BACT|nr:hypothetical protein K239x_25310 [Planctomycetes bacterium K23_9]
MTNIGPPELTVGYCTNVHAGVDFPSICDNLDRFAVSVRNNLIDRGTYGASDDLGVGLWIPETASRDLTQSSNLQDFAAFLNERRLSAFTINGFPFDNFHQDVVKHQVYLPTWCDSERLEYTKRLADILTVIMPGEDQANQPPSNAPVGSISTVPIGWPNNPKGSSENANGPKLIDGAGANFRSMADYLADIESRTGKRIVVAIEPEPGCVLDTTDDVLAFFESQLPEPSHRRYITVCHDVCHSAVMMEPQAEVIGRLARAEIGIGKVQVSSAIVVDWESMANARRIEAIDQLSDFAEDRYLHQTGRRDSTGAFSLAEDLPALIQSVKENRADGQSIVDDLNWVVHFHVPVFLERFGHLSTSHQDVLEVLRTLLNKNSSIDFTGHLEVETYAWTVLPESMRKRGLADDIADEIDWLRKAIVMAG